MNKFKESDTKKLHNAINNLNNQISTMANDTKTLQSIVVNISQEAKLALAECYKANSRENCVENTMNSYEFSALQKENASFYMAKDFDKLDSVAQLANKLDCNKYTELLNEAYPEVLRECNAEAEELQFVSKGIECVRLGKLIAFDLDYFEQLSSDSMNCHLELNQGYYDAAVKFNSEINNHPWHQFRSEI